MVVQKHKSAEDQTVVIMPYERCEEIYIENLGCVKVNWMYSFIKRMIDILFSSLALVVLALPMLIISFLIKGNSNGSVFFNKYENYILGFIERLKVKFGLAGLAQVNGGYHLRSGEQIQCDVEYINRRSFGLDIRIIYATIQVIVSSRGHKMRSFRL